LESKEAYKGSEKMNTNLLLMMGAVLLILFIVVAIALYLSPSLFGNIEAKSTTQYSAPIGPTREYPYILESSLIKGSGR